jgi:hypothetical protein
VTHAIKHMCTRVYRQPVQLEGQDLDESHSKMARCVLRAQHKRKKQVLFHTLNSSTWCVLCPVFPHLLGRVMVLVRFLVGGSQRHRQCCFF